MRHIFQLGDSCSDEFADEVTLNCFALSTLGAQVNGEVLISQRKFLARVAPSRPGSGPGSRLQPGTRSPSVVEDEVVRVDLVRIDTNQGNLIVAYVDDGAAVIRPDVHVVRTHIAR